MTTEQRWKEFEAGLVRLKNTLQQLEDAAVERRQRPDRYDEALARTNEAIAQIGDVLTRHNETLVRHDGELVRNDGELARRDEAQIRHDEELAEYRRESAQMRRLMIRIAEKNGWLDENGDISSPF